MSEILSNIVVEQTSINFSPNNNNLNVTPEAIQLNIFTGAAPSAGQSSNGELLYNNTNLIDGVPNTSFASGNLTLGNVANIKITGGTNGFVLQTDGAGNLDWTAMSGNGGGNGTPGGSNTQIQYNDAGSFGGSTGFTFNKISNLVSMPGNLTVTGNISGTNANLSGNITAVTVTANLNGSATTAGTVTGNAQSNITSVGTLNTLAVNGSLTAVNITANTGIFTGNGAGLTNVPGANVTGTVANATFATTAGTVTTNAQPNITSVGNLTSLTVTGNITANTGIFTGNAAGLTNIPGANVTGTVANATFATNTGTANSATTANTVTTNAQPNITSLGILTSLSLSSSNIELGSGAQADGEYAIAIGDNAETANTVALDYGLAIGYTTYAGNNSVAIGPFAGKFVANKAANASSSVAIGSGAGYGNTRGRETVAIGQSAGINQRANSVAIGTTAGINAGVDSIAIGQGSCFGNTVFDNTIVLNATGSALNPLGANGLYIKPISSQNTSNVLTYNPTSGFVGYSNDITANLITGGNVVPSANNSGNLGFTGQRWLNVFANDINVSNLANIANLKVTSSNITLGSLAGNSGQANTAIAIGSGAAPFSQGANAIAIGTYACSTTFMPSGAIAIGINAANAGGLMGADAIAIGTNAGRGTAPLPNSIVLNATGANLTSVAANSLVIKPIRTNIFDVFSNNNVLMYNATTGEIAYETLAQYTGYIKTLVTDRANLAGAGANQGLRAMINDANTATFNAVVGGGGSNIVPVFSDGTDWRVG